MEKQEKQKGNLFVAIFAAIFVGLICSVAWAWITAITAYQIGYMAIGVGAIIGFTVRFVGKGHTWHFALTGAIISLVSCVVGDILVPVFGDVYIEWDMYSLLFFGIAVVEGWSFSRKKEDTNTQEEEQQQINKENNE
jgi:hypothetical protein